MVKTIKAIKAMLINKFCYQLIVPEYKGYHLSASILGIMDWREMYPVDVRVIILAPASKLFR